jgi:hypothetical protein
MTSDNFFLLDECGTHAASIRLYQEASSQEQKFSERSSDRLPSLELNAN